MAFKHISASRLSFLLTSDGLPSGFQVNGEVIPIGSLSIDRINGKTYQLKPNSAWEEFGTGNAGTAGGAVPTELFEELADAGTSAPLTYNLGFNPLPDSVKVFVNGQLAMPYPLTNYDYQLAGTTITWTLTPIFPIDDQDQIVVYYDTFDI